MLGKEIDKIPGEKMTRTGLESVQETGELKC